MNKYEITTQNKKTAIIDAALTLFGENGFTDVSIREIAAHAHVSQVSIYNYFGSKEALVAECANIIIHDVLQRATEILERDIDFIEKLKLALTLCTEELSNSISAYFSTKALDDTTMLDLLVENVNRSKAKVYRDYIEFGKKEGCIDSSIATDTIIDYMEALNIMGSKLKFYDDTTTKISHIHQLFLYGLLGHNALHKEHQL